MGCDDIKEKINEGNKNKNRYEDDYVDINPSNTNEIKDERLINFFNSNNNTDELKSFLFSTKPIINNNINQSEKPKNLENYQIYYEYGKCDEISKKNDLENEFFIVSEDFMKEVYQGFNNIKDKSVKINKQTNSYNIIFNNSNNFIQFKSKENGFFSFYHVDNDFNPDSYFLKDNIFYYKINYKSSP